MRMLGIKPDSLGVPIVGGVCIHTLGTINYGVLFGVLILSLSTIFVPMPTFYPCRLISSVSPFKHCMINIFRPFYIFIHMG